jgi:hypothetical protein
MGAKCCFAVKGMANSVRPSDANSATGGHSQRRRALLGRAGAVDSAAVAVGHARFTLAVAVAFDGVTMCRWQFT